MKDVLKVSLRYAVAFLLYLVIFLAVSATLNPTDFAARYWGAVVGITVVQAIMAVAQKIRRPVGDGRQVTREVRHDHP